ncbi:MAG: hypothetical protein LBU56_05430 [Rickettsiales bacterium]|jgi:hypothetical protein|nr:hypothetical protein [Rickettsiales bacterium]
MPSPQGGRDKLVNLEEEGHDLYSAKSSNNQESSNPFIPPLSKVKLSVSESIKLERFLKVIKKVETASELDKVVYAALDAGVRINVCRRGQRSFVDTVVSKMLLMQCPKDTQEIIIEELLLKGAMFSYDLLQDKRVSEVYNKLRPEVQPKIEKRLQELREVGENALENEGSVEEVGIEKKHFL